jgi:CBS domain-containing protein
MTVGSVCVRDVVIATPEMTIPEVAKLMREFHVGSLVVVDAQEGKNVPVGIVTDRDLVVEVLAQGVAPGSVTVGDVMSHEPLIAREDESLWGIIQRMRAKGVRRAPVVDDARSLVGILSVDDLVQLLGDELSALAALFGTEQQKETRRRTRP